MALINVYLFFYHIIQAKYSMGRCFVKSDYSNEPSISSQFSRALSVAFVCCFGELPFPFQPKYLMTPDLLSCNFLVRYFLSIVFVSDFCVAGGNKN